jgi:catecholate siderophore receptor
LNEHFDIVLGARFDSFDIEVFNAHPDALETRQRTDEEVSPRAGLIYKPSENVSFYASYSESFLPRSGEQYADINGDDNRLDPNTFTNQEVGVKWDLEQGLSVTFALFENEQSSPQVADNDPSTLDVVESQIDGFELQIAGQITDKLSINANYSQLDGEVVGRSGGTGNTPRELPEQLFSLWSTYQAFDKLGFGVGVTHQDESFINNDNTRVLPSYTRVDAAVYYTINDNLTLQLNIENLTDELYFPHSHSSHQATVAEPVNATLSLIGRL